MKALIIVDIQNDFLPGGALAVPEGDKIIPVVNELQTQFELIVATQDWHPRNHASFAANHPGRQVGQVTDLEGLPQVLWPVHCVQDTAGADFADGLHRDRWARVVQKGTNPEIDSYSGFFDNGHRQATGLADFLAKEKVREIHVVGLATDYCVKFTVLDALNLGFETFLIPEACRGVNLATGDVDRAITEMQNAGARVAPAINKSI